MPKMRSFRNTDRKPCPTCRKLNNTYNNYCVVCAHDLRLKKSIYCQSCFTKQSANNRHCFHCGNQPTPPNKEPVYCEPRVIKPRPDPNLKLKEHDQQLNPASAGSSMETEQIETVADREPAETVESQTVETKDDNNESENWADAE